MFQYASVYFVAHIVPALAFASSSRLAPVPFQHRLILSWKWYYFLTSQDVPGSSFICAAPALKSITFRRAFFPKIPVIVECPPCVLRALQPWAYTSLWVGPGTRFQYVHDGLHPSQGKEGQGFPLVCQPLINQIIPPTSLQLGVFVNKLL